MIPHFLWGVSYSKQTDKLLLTLVETIAQTRKLPYIAIHLRLQEGNKIADDHPLFRKGIRALIETMPDVALVSEAQSCGRWVRDGRLMRID